MGSDLWLRSMARRRLWLGTVTMRSMLSTGCSFRHRILNWVAHLASSECSCLRATRRPMQERCPMPKGRLPWALCTCSVSPTIQRSGSTRRGCSKCDESRPAVYSEISTRVCKEKGKCLATEKCWRDSWNWRSFPQNVRQSVRPEANSVL